MKLDARRDRLLTVPLLVAVLLLASCAAEPAAVETSPPAAPATPEVTPTAEPTPTQEPETGESRPAAVFDADCDAVFDAHTLSEELGEKVRLEPTSSEIYELSLAGGFNCIWRTSNYSTLVNFDLLPQGSIESTTETAECEKVSDGGGWRCEIEHQHNEIRISGFFMVPASVSKSKATRALDAVVDLFDDHATADEAAPAPIPAAEAWTNPVDCTALGDAVDLKPVFSNTPGFDEFASGTDALPSPARLELWGGDGAGLTCTWGTNEELSAKQLASGMVTSFSVGIYGGAAWAQDDIEIEEDATDVSIAGVDRVIRVDRGSSSETYYSYSVINGPNLLTFSSNSKKLGNNAEAVTLIVDYLDSL